MTLKQGGMSADEIKAEYASSLADLTFNSKPLINMLTILAEENLERASSVVAAIEEHLEKVQTDVKLPILYLIDCIMKNIGDRYTQLFSRNIVMTFCSVFKLVDEKTRAEMFKLRQTWNDIFPPMKLYAIDVQIHMLDPAWPVTAKPPPNSIHLNPKFLKKSKAAAVEKSTNDAAVPKKPETSTKDPVPAARSTNPEAFSMMHQQLIQKQKELLELKEKKLELELLQQQVELQKQLKTNPNTTNTTKAAAIPRPQNILLKPEVANQLTKASPAAQKLKASLITSSSGPRIAPANHALIQASIKPIRDPRLLRKQAENSSENSTSASSNSTDTSVSLGSKTAILDSNNKVVTNSKSVRDTRTEPRLVTNKDTHTISSPQKQSDTNNTATTKPSKASFQKSRSEQKSAKNQSRPKSASADSSAGCSSSTSSAKSSASSSTVSLLDSATSPSKSTKSLSSSRHKKKEDSKKSSKESISSSKRDRDSGGSSSSKSHKSDSSTTFKGVKGSKYRNYVRRNRSPSYSPDRGHDVDFRLPPPEKQARLQVDEDTKTKTGLDVDLRKIPGSITKKRSSTESIEVPAKKTKNEMFDVLFGNEDVDLRTVLPGKQPERPPTPPPPIISTVEKEKPKVLPKKISNLDAIRAKLANATGRDRIMAQCFRKKRIPEDEDLRIIPPSPKSGSDSMKKIIISTDDEQCIKAGNMTKEQEKQLMNKIIAQIEHQKLKEAQQKDKETESLQIVSDEELDFPEDTGDRDERMSFHSKPFQRQGGTYRRGATRRRPLFEPAAPIRSNAPWQPINTWRPFGHNFSAANVNQQQQQNIRGPMVVPSDFDSNSLDEGKRSPEDPSDLVVDSVNQDDIKTINIDGVPRDIRYYDETAIVFMNWDDPREISFQSGTRRVVFDDKEFLHLSFDEPYSETSIKGAPHRVRLGAPTREIFIDGKPYECYFGGPGITIDLNGQPTLVKLEGPPPHVKIGTVQRTDLVAGKINLIIDAKTIVPVFLDAKLQKFVIDGETHTLKFVDALKTVLINDVPFRVEFGGLPKPITVHDKKHFIRFSVLPRGVKAGFVKIKDMEGVQVEEDTQSVSFNVDYHNNEPTVPVYSQKSNQRLDEETDRNSNSPYFLQNYMQQQNNLDLLSSVITSSSAPATSSGGYQVEDLPAPVETHTNQPPETVNEIKPVPAPVLPPTLNINELFQKLVATGIVATKEPEVAFSNTPAHQAPSHQVNNNSRSSNSSSRRHQHQHHHHHHQHQHQQPQEPPAVKRTTLESLDRVISFNDLKSLKKRHDVLYENLYAGMQCSSCGMRFPPEQSMQYSQHLDWHFRQNRKGKKNIRVAASRRWYYSLSDWKNYEEIEDLEEREKNYFDQQQSQADGAVEETEEEVEIPSVPADPDIQDAHCDVCQDRFDHFFNEDKEEWHLQNAIRVDNKTYHPLCYEDYKASLMDSVDESQELEDVEEKTENQAQIPGLEIILDDDEEDEENNVKDSSDAQNNEEDQVVIEESDESNNKQSMEKENGDGSDKNDEDADEDDDVIIHEVVPEKVEVDDDREYVDTVPVHYPVKIEQDDGFMDVEDGLISIINGGQIKIKSEPIDPDEVPFVEAPEAPPPEPTPQLAETSLKSSIDGNIEPVSSVPTAPTSMGGRIKINISKPLPVITPREAKEVICDNSILETVIDPSQPLPPGEEPVQLNVKPSLQGVQLKKMPPVKKGSELTGMCSIM